MSRYKKGTVPIIALIIVLLTAMIFGSLFLRSFISSNSLGKSLIRDQKVIRYYYDTENMGTMIFSFLNAKQGELNFATLIGAAEAKNFPLEEKNKIEKTLKEMAVAINKEKCYVILRGAESTKFFGKESSSLITEGDFNPSAKEIDITFDFLPIKESTCISSPYGWRFWWETQDYSDEDNKRWQFHKGIDLGAKDQTIIAVKEGKVDYIHNSCEDNAPHTCLQPGKEDEEGCKCNNGYGNTVVIAHGNKIEKNVYNLIKKKEEKIEAYEYYTVYSHLNEINVNKGQLISAGDVIGTVGNSGKSTNYHLHFGVSKAPYEIEYRSSPLNYYNPCPLFAEESGLKELISGGTESCKSSCEADCMEKTLDPEIDKEEIEMCALSGGIKETTYIPVIGEYDIGTLEISCY